MTKNNTILIAYLAFIAFGIYEGLLGVVWPSMSQTFSQPLDALGVLLLVSVIGFVLVSFTSGLLIRKRSFHWLLLASLLFRTLGFAGLALSPNWLGVVISVFVISLGGGGLDTSLNGYVSTRGSAKQLNWLHACFGIGATLGPFLAAGIFALGASWRWGFAAISVLFAIAALLIRQTGPAWSLPPLKEAGPAPAQESGLRATLRLPVVWLSVAIFFLYTGTELSAGQWSFSLFTIGRGIPALVASTWLGIYWGSFTIGRILFGLIADRVPMNLFLRLALIAGSLGAGLLWWNPLPLVGFAGLTLMGLAQAPVFPSLIAATVHRVGRTHAANTIGFQIAAAGLGGAGLSALIGVLASATSLEVIGLCILVLSLLTLATYESLLFLGRKPNLGR